jgi:hypothetical protein
MAHHFLEVGDLDSHLLRRYRVLSIGKSRLLNKSLELILLRVERLHVRSQGIGAVSFSLLRENDLFFVFSVCLSRACLG